jgi:polyhydroxybutyrate depolymerase
MRPALDAAKSSAAILPQELWCTMALVNLSKLLTILGTGVFVLACSSSSTESPPAGAVGGGGGGPAVVSDAGSDGASNSGGGTGNVVVLTDVMFDDYAVDVFLPSNATRVVVFLHGGGGSKEGAASSEAVIVTGDPPVPDSVFLLGSRTAFVVPQGKAVPGSPKAQTWSNYVMTSGADDLAFLGKLSTSLRGGTFDSHVPAFSRVYLAGHSNGGMMANRVWCEAPQDFDAYGAISGPASIQLSPPTLALVGGADDALTGAHPCAPSTAKPYLGIVGKEDTIIQTKTLWSEDIWAVNSCLSGNVGGGFVDPKLISETRFHEVRVHATCGAVPALPTMSGPTTSWSDCDGRIRLEAIAGAEHCVVEGKLPCLNDKLIPSDCANSLEGATGTHVREALVGFFAGTE